MGSDFGGFEDFIDGIGDYYSSGSSFSSAATGAIVVSNIISSLIGLAALVLTIIALWKIFEKAGKPGWHSLIPFLNIYDLFQISWKKKFGVATIILEICGIVLMIGSIVFFAVTYGSAFLGYMFGYQRGGRLDDYVMSLNASSAIWIMMLMIASIVLVIGAIFTIIAHIKLAQAFGKRGGFLVGMFFVPIVFLCILAFGESTYQGHWENDGFHPDPEGYGYGQVPNNAQYINQQPQNPNMTAGTYNPGAGSVSDIPEAPRYCSGCGTVITPGSKFCSNCGKQF